MVDNASDGKSEDAEALAQRLADKLVRRVDRDGSGELSREELVRHFREVLQAGGSVGSAAVGPLTDGAVNERLGRLEAMMAEQAHVLRQVQAAVAHVSARLDAT